MRRWQRYCAGLAAVIGLTPAAFAQQFPGILSPTPTLAVPAAAAIDDVAGAPAAPAVPQANLFSIAPAVLPSGERSVYNILTNAIEQPPRPVQANGTDGDRLVPQTAQVAPVAPKPALIELEPRTDLYHVLMARRQ